MILPFCLDVQSFMVSSGKSKTNFLVNKTFDSVLLIWGVFLPIAFLTLYLYFGVPVASLTLMFVLCLDGPHAMQTITRVLMDSHGRAIFGRRTVYGFILMAMLCGLLILLGQTFYILVILLFYGPYHIIMQHFGITMLYRARAESTTAVGGNRDKILLISTYCLSLSWACNNLFNLGPIFLWAEFVAPFNALGLDGIPALITRIWSLFVVPASFVFFAASLIVWVCGIRQELRGGMAINKPRVLVLVFAVLNYVLVFFLLNGIAQTMDEGLFMVVVGITAWHALQYNGLVWHYNNKKFSCTKSKYCKSQVLSWISQRNRVLYYAGFIAVLSLGTHALVLGLFWFDIHIIKAWVGSSKGLAFMAYSVTFTHYYLDSLIWKGKHNKELSTVLL